MRVDAERKKRKRLAAKAESAKANPTPELRARTKAWSEEEVTLLKQLEVKHAEVRRINVAIAGELTSMSVKQISDRRKYMRLLEKKGGGPRGDSALQPNTASHTEVPDRFDAKIFRPTSDIDLELDGTLVTKSKEILVSAVEGEHNEDKLTDLLKR